VAHAHVDDRVSFAGGDALILLTDEERSILEDYLYGGLSQRELAKKYHKSLRDINDLIKNFKDLIRQYGKTLPGNVSSSALVNRPIASTNSLVSQQVSPPKKVAEVVARYLEALDNLVAERVEAMLDASLIHYHNNQVYQALRYVRAASAFVKEVLSMMRSEEFSNFIMAAANLENVIRLNIGYCMKACRERRWP